MIGQRQPKQTEAEKQRAYDDATARDEDTCVFRSWDCRGPVHRDHRQNRMPGNTRPSNLQLLCAKHHQWKTEHPEEAVERGYAVSRYRVPLEWPARRWVTTTIGTLRSAWVLYLDDLDEAGRWWIEITDTEALDLMGRSVS
jgi:hypothetical protein